MQQNARKNLGKLFNTIREGGDAKDIGKWALRSTFGAAFSGLGGARRGMMTTDRAGRRTATQNAVDATQSRQKLHDAGYGSGLPGPLGLATKGGRKQAGDAVRNFFGMDLNVGDMADSTDASIQGLQHRIAEMERTYNGPTISESKAHKGMFTLRDSSGEIIKNGSNEFWSAEDLKAYMPDSNGKNADEKITIDNRTYRRKDISDGSILAGLYKSAGKLQSRSKALNQKNAEQQSKSGK